jgi:hypothetical protein
MSMVKDKAEFDCIMEERRRRYCLTNCEVFSAFIKVEEDGSPARKRDLKVLCEMQKLALGMETAYIECHGPGLTDGKSKTRLRRDYGLAPSDLVIAIRLRVPASESDYLRRFFLRLVTNGRDKRVMGEAVPLSLPFGSSCAFQGACD